MEILWWLVPSLVVTAAAMVWTSWVGREGHGEVDREVAVQRLAKALSKERPTPAKPEGRVRDRSTGLAVRPTREHADSPRPTRRVS